jgi:predicted nucleic-acid-binding protein
MIGLDTNLIVRYLMQDDPVQSDVAIDVMERRLTENEPGFISVVAMAEVVWVLQRSYRLKPKAIAGAVERILQAETLVVESEKEVFTAMIFLKAGIGEFADALIGALGSKAGCRHTLTFDRRALQIPGFRPA